MPADALAVPHPARLSAPLGLTTTGFTLTFGIYAEAPWVGMKAIIRRSVAYVDGAGDVSQVTWTATVADDGTASVGLLPYNDDGSTYSVEWQALSYLPTPGNKTLQVLSTSGLTTVDYDALQQLSPTTPVATALADGAIAALLDDTSSATYAKVAALIAARAGFGGI